MIKKGKKEDVEFEVTSIYNCSKCSPDMKEMFGCGFIGLDQKGKMAYSKGATNLRTCPEWIISTNFVTSFLEIYTEWKADRLKISSLDLPNNLLTYLQVYESESERLKQFLQSKE